MRNMHYPVLFNMLFNLEVGARENFTFEIFEHPPTTVRGKNLDDMFT